MEFLHSTVVCRVATMVQEPNSFLLSDSLIHFHVILPEETAVGRAASYFLAALSARVDRFSS